MSSGRDLSRRGTALGSLSSIPAVAVPFLYPVPTAQWPSSAGRARVSHLLVSAPFPHVPVSMHEDGRDLWSPMPMLHFGEYPTPRGFPTDLMQPHCPVVSASPRAWMTSVAQDGRVVVNRSRPGRRCAFRSGTRPTGEVERFGAAIFWS